MPARFFLLIILFYRLVFSLPLAAQAGGEIQQLIDEPRAQIIEPPKKNGLSVELVRASEGEFLSASRQRDGMLILRGGILLRFGSQNLRAETVKINLTSGEIFAEGNLNLADGEQILEGSRFIYDNRRQLGVLFDSQARIKPLFLSGEQIKMVAPETYVASLVYFSAVREEEPEFYFRARKLWLYPDNQLAALDLVYYVGSMPVFYLPAYLQTQTGTGIASVYGFNRLQGHFLQNTYGFPVLAGRSNAAVMFDWYQYNGMFFGTRLWQKSSRLSYDFQASVADYKQKELAVGYSQSGSPLLTNLVVRPDGTVGEVHELWWKLKGNASASWQHGRSGSSSLYLKFDHYRNRMFEPLFGYRIVPRSSLDMFQLGSGLNRNNPADLLNWKMHYSTSWQNNTFSFEVSRDLKWYDMLPASSGYLPLTDILPRISYSNNRQISSARGKIYGGMWSQFSANGALYRSFVQGLEQKTLLAASARQQFSWYFSLLPWVNLSPALGLGLEQQAVAQKNPGLQSEADRNSYFYLFSDTTLRVGPPFLFAQAKYHVRSSFADRLLDPIFGHQKMHYLNLSLVAEFLPFWSLSASASRDMRAYPYSNREHDRWSPLKIDSRFDLDFVQGPFSDDYGLRNRRRSHYAGLGLSNSFSYLLRYQRPGQNDFNIYFQMGGYKPLFFRELLHFRAGLTWHSDFTNPLVDYLAFNWEADFRANDYWRFKLGGLSRTRQMDRYSPSNPQYVSFLTDVANSLNFFNPQAQGNAMFNLENFHLVVEHDLHHWILQLTFNTGRNAAYFGLQNRDRVIYYEQSIYISLHMKEFPGVGIPDSQIYRTDISRSGIY